LKQNDNGQPQKPLALVTGASSFLGRAICLHLARKGFNLLLHFNHSSSLLKELGEELEKIGAKVSFLRADLVNVNESAKRIRKSLEKCQALKLLVNNAALFYPTPPSKVNFGQWQRLFNVNLFSPYFLGLTVFPWLKKDKGSIVNLTDIYGENPILKDYSAYCVSKSGLITATKILARELGPDVRVNGVSPGAIAIPKTYGRRQRVELINRSALKSQGKPEDIAEAVYFLAAQSFITGQILKVDGGRFLN
jgi:pteridine reductase